jgi:hypothetical protein
LYEEENALQLAKHTKNVMRTKVLISAAFGLLLALGSCRQSSNNEDTSNPSGNNNPSEENKGNHANDPQALPGTNYPGSAGHDTAGRQMGDTLHKARP